MDVPHPLSAQPAGPNPLAGRRLSSPVHELGDHYDVVVVGSGYGGGIAASRLARAGRRVCLLERGKEFQPGEYPDALTETVREFQIESDQGHFGPRTGLYHLHANREMNVFVGCGLGGTSLVNANVSLRAEPRVFEDECWPAELRADLAGGLARGYELAEEMLKPMPYPEHFPALKKLEALERATGRLEGRFYRPPINVTFADGVNHVGVFQQACRLAGDCITGCNYAAKNTTLMNYLPDAHNHGAEIYTAVEVRHVARREGRWLVYYRLLDSGREVFDAPPLFVSADVVVLGAGTLGSTEILLRSREQGLSLSPRLGTRFTGNGDVLAFAYNCDEEIDGMGWGDHAPGELPAVGPCITGIVDLRDQPELAHGMVIEEGSVPGPLSAVLARVFEGVAEVVGRDTDPGLADRLHERGRELESFFAGAYHGALRNTLTFLVMTHDDAGGSVVLEGDRPRVTWPGVGREEIFRRVEEKLLEATRALGGEYVKNPIWSKFFKQELVTVHPLGGCPMGEDAASGVVNHKGQVFSGSTGTGVHDGLYVCDGSVVPRSLGVNPLLTISALAERTCALLAGKIDYSLPSAPRAAAPAPRPGIQFTETMKGFFSSSGDTFEHAAEQGRASGSSFEFTLTIVSEDLDALLDAGEHGARIVGTVSAPGLSARPLVVSNGTFNLFVSDPGEPKTRRMRYRMSLGSEEGRKFWFDGFKLIHDDPGLDMWADTTTLYVTVWEGGDDSGSPFGKGILKIHPQDFLRQMTTMRVTHAVDARRRVAAMGRFAAYFTGSLHDVYGVV